MARPHFTDRALVVRHYDFGEADRVIVLLTREHGIVRAVVKGVRKSKTRFGSRLSLFVDSEVTLYSGRNLATLTGVESVSNFANHLIGDYDRYIAGCQIIEAAERLADSADPEPLYDLTVNCLAALAGQAGDSALALLSECDLSVIVDYFLVHACQLAGWNPSLFNCASCGAAGPHHCFNPEMGGAVCGSCRPPGARTVPTESLRLAWWLQHDKLTAVADATESADDPDWPSIRDSCHRNLITHVQWHIGAPIRSAHPDLD